MKTLGKAMEGFWLILGVISLFWAIYQTVQTSFEETKLFYLVPILCFAMFFFRKFMNGKLAKMAEYEEKRRQERDAGS